MFVEEQVTKPYLDLPLVAGCSKVYNSSQVRHGPSLKYMKYHADIYLTKTADSRLKLKEGCVSETICFDD